MKSIERETYFLIKEENEKFGILRSDGISGANKP